jgi:hypothetical protein
MRMGNVAGSVGRGLFAGVVGTAAMNRPGIRGGS